MFVLVGLCHRVPLWNSVAVCNRLVYDICAPMSVVNIRWGWTDGVYKQPSSHSFWSEDVYVCTEDFYVCAEDFDVARRPSCPEDFYVCPEDFYVGA